MQSFKLLIQTILLCSTVLFLSISSASTFTVDMEGIAVAGGDTNEFNGTRVFGDYTLGTVHGHFISSTRGSPFTESGSDWYNNDGGSPFSLEATSGDIFDLVSFRGNDTRIVAFGGEEGFVSGMVFNVEGTLSGGGTVTATFVSDALTLFETFILGASFTGLTSVSFNNTNPNSTLIGRGGYDDIVVSMNMSVVPVPAAFWLFGTAMIGLVGFGRRRKAA